MDQLTDSLSDASICRKQIMRAISLQNRVHCTKKESVVYLSTTAMKTKLYFSLTMAQEPMGDLRVMLMIIRAFTARKQPPLIALTELRLQLNDSNLTSTGKLVSLRIDANETPEVDVQRSCHFSKSVDIYWLIFDEQQAVVNSIEVSLPLLDTRRNIDTVDDFLVKA